MAQMEQTFDTRSSEKMAMHHRCRQLLNRYNSTVSEASEERSAVLSELLGHCGRGIWIEPPFYCDYGSNIDLGDGVVLNFNCVVLDGANITIGAGTLIGPAVQIYATGHPIESDERVFVESGKPTYRTNASPVSIGERVWVGGGAIILPGVCVGNGTTIGSGSVVTKSLPDNVFAAGNPCKVIRAL